jgi:RecB family endonuclease NucS
MRNHGTTETKAQQIEHQNPPSNLEAAQGDAVQLPAVQASAPPALRVQQLRLLQWTSSDQEHERSG